MSFRESDAFADLSADSQRCLDDSHGMVVLFHNHLDTLPHLGQNTVGIMGEFGFCDANGSHPLDHNVVVKSLPQGTLPHEEARLQTLPFRK